MTERRTGVVLTPEQERALDLVRPHVDQLQAEFGDRWEIGPCHPWNGTVGRLYAKRRTEAVGELPAVSARTVEELRVKLRERH
ncbi:hypothetical protein [Nocardiopsis lambiniae]|uniref:Helix-turn-helix DNA binding domain protein n=1 Tax=Nocardiopsis lambiniae TaxID=3075539 RepID=A0ABU2M2R3_9ACTN|nr:hypothetical protein [Nocardiopsis sp. DSM 44743]MDT0326941.1 hypothetical protein [Nocardiopsis sp. DSM 44743]